MTAPHDAPDRRAAPETTSGPPADFSPAQLAELHAAQRRLDGRKEEQHQCRSTPARWPEMPRPVRSAQPPAARPPRSHRPVRERPSAPQLQAPAAFEAALQRAEVSIGASIPRRAQPRARTVMRALLHASYQHLAQRGWRCTVTSATWFTVLDALPAVTGLAPSTCQAAVADLRGCGLIATWRTHATDSFLDPDGTPRTRKACTGVWLTVALSGDTLARTPHADLPAGPPRDLRRDRLAGHTAWKLRQDQQTARPAQVGASSSPEQDWMTPSPLLSWTPKELVFTSLADDDAPTCSDQDVQLGEASAAEVVWALSAHLGAHPRARHARIGLSGARLASALGDTGRVNLYRRMLHQAVRAEACGMPALAQLAYRLTRVTSDHAELGLRRPGAWLVAALKRDGWWDAVWNLAQASSSSAELFTGLDRTSVA